MKKLTYLFLALIIVACSDDGGDNESNACNGDNPIYLANNGVTIKACEFANAGDTGVFNGVTYTVVDEEMLREMVANEIYVARIATTKVTNMENLFDSVDDDTYDFNQPIGNWDVSNVTNMELMFYTAKSFNQDLSSWSVDNVTDCGSFSGDAPLTEANTPNFTNCTP